MPAPQTTITRRVESPPRFSALTNTGLLHAVGLAEKGPANEPVRVESPSAFTDRFGERGNSYSLLADAAETFFGEGGTAAVVARVVGPNAVASDVVVQDQAGTPQDTLRFYGDGPGIYYDDYQVVITNSGSTYTVDVQYKGDSVEKHTGLADPPAAVRALEPSVHVHAEDLGSTSGSPNPADGTYGLTGGDDDSANVTDSEWQAALDAITADWGTGQVAAPGRTTTSGHEQLIAHAEKTRRTALLDGDEAASVSSLANTPDSLAASNSGTSRAIFCSGWVRIPDDGDVRRDAAPSSFVAGLIARNDAADHPGDAPIHEDGQASHAIAATNPRSPEERDTLAEGRCVDLIDDRLGLRLDGFYSVLGAPWHHASASRVAMAIEADAHVAGEQFIGEPINNETISRFEAVLSNIAKRYYDVGALFGASARDAFDVDTSMNTDQTAANGELLGDIYGRITKFAEFVRVAVIRTRI
jgi:hypothetical protein